MHLEIINNLAGFTALENDWNDLLSCCSASHVPFLRHEYLKTWWKTLGGGEWSNGELFIVTGRRADKTLAGIAPLFLTKTAQGASSLMLLGSVEISDYLDLIVSETDLPEFIEALLDLLASEFSPAWQILDLYNLPELSPTLPALKLAAEKHGWNYSQEVLQPCPVITLPGDWEAYLASIDKKQRHEIRRKMRRAEESELPVRWYIVEDASKLEQETDDFLELMAQDTEKAGFLTLKMRAQMQDAVQAAFKAGWLQLAFLEVDGKKAAGYLNFDYAGHIWVYNSGLRFDYRELSPGWVLLGHLLKWANDNQRNSFDFMRGDEEYKYRFGAVNRFVMRASVQRPLLQS